MSRQAATVRTPRAKPRHVESQHQRALIEWATLMSPTYPPLRLLAAVPNGGARSKVEASIMKAEGVRPGFPDLILPAARGGYHGLTIEMKDPALLDTKSGGVTTEQRWWQGELASEGYLAVVCWGWDQAKLLLMNYCVGRITR